MRPGAHCGRYSSDLWLSVAGRPGFGVTISSLWSMLVSSELLLQYLNFTDCIVALLKPIPRDWRTDRRTSMGGAQQRPEGELSFRRRCQPVYIRRGSRRIGNDRECRKIEASPALSLTGVTAARISGIASPANKICPKPLMSGAPILAGAT